MKKSYLLSGMIVLGAIAGMARASEEYKQPSLKTVMKGKLARQKDLARPPVYKMLDPLLLSDTIDWLVIFKMLDSMKGVINVNEYRSPEGYTLLNVACSRRNLSAAKTLLEKYKANPDRMDLDEDGETVLHWACYSGNVPLVKLLIQYGANPNLQTDEGATAFDCAKGKPEILSILNSSVYRQSAAAA